jgi:ATP-dependent Clp protease ATP-binding subunit ClpC
MDQNIIEKFTTHLKSVLVRAYTLAHELNHLHITPDHLLWSLLTERGCLGAEILQKAHISHEHVREAIARRVQKNGAESPRRVPVQDAADIPLPTLSETTKHAIEKAVLTASAYEHKFVGTEHLLSGMLQAEDTFLIQLLTAEAVDIAALKEQLAALLRSTSAFPDLAEDIDDEHALTSPKTPQEEVREAAGDEPQRAKRPGSKTPALDFFTVDLTGAEAQKRIDPVIGREKEIERMIHILARRTKNNPVLLGDPGVGKTAIVEGLARRIIQGAVPDALRGKHLLGLDLALVVAGTVYRGEFEGRIKQIIDEVKTRPDVILFIDEVHNISGTGAASGSMDAANILKPALARGDIRCIGATTLTEYKKSIESDPALDRRFQAITVREPSAAETEEILRGIRTQYEAFHSIHISDEAIAAAVAFGGRYLQDRTFPDKAIDLIDEASAALRIKLGSPTNKERNALEEKLSTIRNKKQQAVEQECFVEALELKEEATLIEALHVLDTTKPKTPPRSAAIGQREIAAVVAHMTGVPESSILAEETNELEDLEKRLAARVVGQDAVHRAISEHVRRARAGLTRQGRPLGSFLFLGQSGVGKTSLATALAEELFHDPKALLRLDMSEFGESFTVSKMLGSPAGYVGYRDGTKLTDLIKRRPYSVVLFDEVEKAHPDVLNILLQILEDGKLTDATGRAVYFSQALIILTSNIGGEKFRKGTLGFSTEPGSSAALLQDVRREAQQFFRPELINRLDNVLVFRPLDVADIRAILAAELNRINTHIAHRGIRIRVTPKAIALLVTACDAGRMGARAVRAVIQEKIESPLATRLLAGTMNKQRVFTVDAAHNTLRYR